MNHLGLGFVGQGKAQVVDTTIVLGLSKFCFIWERIRVTALESGAVHHFASFLFIFLLEPCLWTSLRPRPPGVTFIPPLTTDIPATKEKVASFPLNTFVRFSFEHFFILFMLILSVVVVLVWGAWKEKILEILPSLETEEDGAGGALGGQGRRLDDVVCSGLSSTRICS